MSYSLTTKSQVTLPKAIREHLKVAPGDAVEFRIVADGTVRVESAGLERRAIGEPNPRALARFRKMRGTAPTRHTTEELMSMLRGYEDDAADPGFGGNVAVKKTKTARR